MFRTSRCRRAALPMLTISTFVLVVACASGPDGEPRPASILDANGALPEVPGAEVYGLEPIGFLEALTRTEGYWITLQQDAPQGWLDDADAAALEAKLGSSVPCPHVLSARAATLPMGGGTTEGEMARYMIAALRAGRFPIDTGSADDSY